MDELLSRQIARLESELAHLTEVLPNRPNTYLPKLGKTAYELGMLYWQECNDLERAETFLTRSAEYYDRYTGRIRQALFDRIETLRQLVILYRLTDRTEQIEKTLLRLLKIYEPLAQKYWWIYSENVAIIPAASDNCSRHKAASARQKHVTAPLSTYSRS